MTLNSTEFKPADTTALFEEGRRVVHAGEAWRTTPPGALREEGEAVQCRAGRCLTYLPRGPLLPIRAPRNRFIPPFRQSTDPGARITSPIPD